ncbi:MAG TPA: rRNA maturation RNase YbeY [Candidatus Omnitrophota bacterium]|nr:rRNA maturation RNase YbeY [Candidatus Omnitrophota bacterium]HPS20713.1 rRNA maturation RNase YbeY [Candidatus Omnitrophota bacterium]
MAKANCQNKNRKVGVSLRRMEAVAEYALNALKKGNAEVNIVFVGNKKICSLNRKYLASKKTTDVIAFWEEEAAKSPENGMVFMGDVAISTDKAVENAKKFGTALNEEIALYVIHGILHLAGFDDIDEKDRKIMERKQNELLEKYKKVL